MAEPISAPILDLLRQSEQEFASRSGEVFRTVINLETTLSLLTFQVADAAALGALGPEDLVCVEAPFIKGPQGRVAFLFEKTFTAMVVDYMIMGDGDVEFMAEEHLDGIVEAVNQLMGNELTELSGRVGVSLRNEVNPARLMTQDEIRDRFVGWVLVTFDTHIDGREPVRLYKLISPDLALALGEMLGATRPAEGDPNELFSVSAKANAASARNPGDESSPEANGQSPSAPEAVREVRQAQFTDFGPTPAQARGKLQDKMSDAGLGRLMDLRLPVVIELGRTRMLIKDIVELSPGSVIELNKLVGEPVDLYVNGKRFAQGEVVVIDENFGVRVTELVPMDQRLRQAGEA